METTNAPGRSRIVAIHQPNYLPWWGFFDKAAKADVLVLLDNVQYPKRSWTNRVRVKGPEGPVWLSVPVKVKGRFDQLVCQAEVSYEEPWVARHLKTLERYYRGGDGYVGVAGLVEPVLVARPLLIGDLNGALIRGLLSLLGLDVQVVLGSSLGVTANATALLVAITQAVGGTAYLSGDGATGYQEPELYAANGLELLYQGLEHPVYPQRHGEFVAGLSVFDALSCWGVDAVRLALQRTRATWGPRVGRE